LARAIERSASAGLEPLSRPPTLMPPSGGEAAVRAAGLALAET